jgi:hypothetical protein
MPDSADKPSNARSPLAGCTIFIAAVLVMMFLVGFSVYVLFRQYHEIEKFTSPQPVALEVPVLEDREAELNQLAENLENFRQRLLADEAAELSLSAAEMNLAIAAFAPLKELRGTFRIEEVGEDHLRIAISFPLNGRPRLTRDEETGLITSDMRYLNGTMIARPRLARNEISLLISEIEVPGAEVPREFVEQMSPYRITERYVADPVLGPPMARLTSVALENGRFVMRRVPGEAQAGEMTDAEVESGTSRFFAFLAVGAVIFLIVVGLMLFVGLRAKGRANTGA